MSAPSSGARVVVVDPDAPVRAGARRVLSDFGLTVCAEATGLDDGVLAVAAYQPELCLLDAPSRDGRVAAITEMGARAPHTRVVVLTGSDRDQDVAETLRAGGWGHLSKDMDPARLPQALLGVLDDEPAISRRHAGVLLRELWRPRRLEARSGRRFAERLSAREWQVLDLLVEGCSTRAIAGRLSISAVTVRRHASTAMRKLGVPDREAAVELLRGQAS